MSADSEKVEDIKTVIRALLLPLRDGLQFKRLDRDYHEVEGKYIPYRELGYTSLLEFIRDIPDVASVRTNRGEVFLYPVANEETQHIQNLVSKQKKSNTSLSKSNHRPYRPPHYRTPHVASTASHRVSSLPPRFQGTPVCRRIIERTLNIQKQSVPFIVKDHLTAILQQYPTGIQLDNLKSGYQKSAGIELEPQLYGYSSLEAFLEALQSEKILRIQRRGDNFVVLSFDCQNFQLPAEQASHPQMSKYDSHNQSQHHNPSLSAETKEYLTDSSRLNDKILANMRRLRELFQDGIPITDLCDKYKEVTGSLLDLHELGFNNVHELVNELGDIFHVKDWVLIDVRKQRPETPKAANNLWFGEPENIPDDVQQNIYDMLNIQPDGFLLSELERAYRMNFDQILPWQRLNFQSLEDFVKTLDFTPPIRLQPSGLTDYKVIISSKNSVSDSIQQPPKQMVIPEDAVRPGDMYVNLKLGPDKDEDFFPVLVAEIESPGKIWLQLISSDNVRVNIELDNLMDSMEEFYNSSESKKYLMPDEYLIKSMVCAVIYTEDQNWHRGCIVGKKGPSTYQVFYYDYGTVCIVEKDLIRLLKQSFHRLPAQAFPARLSNIKPNGEHYTLASKQRLFSLTTTRPLMAKITSRRYHNTFSVLLCDTSGEDDIFMNTVLIDEQHALRSEDYDEPPRKPHLATSPTQLTYSSPAVVHDLLFPNDQQHHTFNSNFSPTFQFPSEPLQTNFNLESGLQSHPEVSTVENPAVDLQSRLDPEIVKRLMEKKKKLHIPQATVGPMQYNRQEGAEPETLVPLTPAANVQVPMVPAASHYLSEGQVPRNTTSNMEETIVFIEQENLLDISSSSLQGASASVGENRRPQTRFCKRVTFQNQDIVVHLINFFGQPCFSSADVSLLIFVVDIVKKMLRFNKRPSCHLIAMREDHQQLFSELELCSATGFTNRDTPTDKLVLYSLPRVNEILNFFDYQNATVLDEIRALSRDFKPNDSYWYTSLDIEEEISEDVQALEEQLRALKTELSALALTADDSERLLKVSQDIHSIQLKLKKLATKVNQPSTKSASELAREFLNKVKSFPEIEEDSNCSVSSQLEAITAVPATTVASTSSVISVSIEETVVPTMATQNSFPFLPRQVGGAPLVQPMSRHALPPSSVQVPLMQATAPPFHPSMMMRPYYVQGYNYSAQIPAQFPTQPFVNNPQQSHGNYMNYMNWQ